MNLRTIVCVALAAIGLGGCSPPQATHATHQHQGAKISIPDFARNTAAYKGKTITLDLKIDETSAPDKRLTLRELVGKDVKFAAAGKADRLTIVIKIPADLAIPEGGQTNEYRITFVCKEGSLRQGNEAKSVMPPG